MPDRPCTDPCTGLPLARQALHHLSALMPALGAAHCLGLVVVGLPPSPALLRLPAEAVAQLRREMGERLQACLRPRDSLYVLDEWTWLAILPELPSSAPVTLAMLKLRRAASQPPLAGGLAPGLEPVCGGAVAPDQGEDPVHLLQSARIAALAARPAAGVALYDPAMEREEASAGDLAAQLRQALAGEALELHLQPQLETAGGRCTGAEALLRWQHRPGEWLPSPLIIATLERAGLRHRFNRWLFRQATSHLARLREAHIPVTLSVNLTGNDLLDLELPDLIAQSLDTWRLPPRSLVLEITETVAIRESRELMEVLKRLRDQGLSLSVDDFGTGYAGMTYLQRLPIQELKIDRRFVAPLAHSPRDREIAASVIALAHRLGLEVVAEGVETPASLEILRELGCNRVQGFLFSPALPLPEFMAWWREHQ